MTTAAHVNGSGPISASFAIASPITTFDEVLARFEIEIYRYLLQLTRSRTQADELYEEMVTRAFQAFGRLDGTVNHRAWIYKLATSTFLRNQRQVAHDRPLKESHEAAIDERESEHERHNGSDLIRDIEEFINSLPTEQRVALVLRRYHDLSYDEIGENLNCSEAAARANAHGALRMLRDRFSDRL
jgi:RNA polymerase sigma-70 factor (ECF subfamily)